MVDDFSEEPCGGLRSVGLAHDADSVEVCGKLCCGNGVMPSPGAVAGSRDARPSALPAVAQCSLKSASSPSNFWSRAAARSAEALGRTGNESPSRSMFSGLRLLRPTPSICTSQRPEISSRFRNVPRQPLRSGELTKPRTLIIWPMLKELLSEQLGGL